jgi:hypothetical protein
MNKYKIAKIYLIKSKQTDNVYVGSTCQKLLSQRLAKHKYDIKNGSNASSKHILKYDDAYIELYENFPCNNKNEMHKREREIIKLLNACNKVIPTRTKKEWQEENKEHIKEVRRRYKEANKEKIRIKNKEYREKNKDKIKLWHNEHKNEKKEYDKQRYLKRKEEISKKQKEKIYCDVCKKYITKGAIRRHNKSKSHLSKIKIV